MVAPILIPLAILGGMDGVEPLRASVPLCEKPKLNEIVIRREERLAGVREIAGVPARYVKCPGKYIAVAVNERHDYQLSVQRLMPGNVVAEFSIDGESQCRMTCKNFEVARRCAIAAARAYAKYKAHIAQSHKARKERIRAAKAAAQEAQP